MTPDGLLPVSFRVRLESGDALVSHHRMGLDLAGRSMAADGQFPRFSSVQPAQMVTPQGAPGIWMSLKPNIVPSVHN
jgi:hypothetical protein